MFTLPERYGIVLHHVDGKSHAVYGGEDCRLPTFGVEVAKFVHSLFNIQAAGTKEKLDKVECKVDEDDPVLEHIFQRYFAFGLFDLNACRRTEHEEPSEHEWKCFDSAIHSITTLSYVLDGVVTQMVDDIASFAGIEHAHGWRYDAIPDTQTLSVTGPRHRKMSVSFAKVDAHWMASCQAANHALE